MPNNFWQVGGEWPLAKRFTETFCQFGLRQSRKTITAMLRQVEGEQQVRMAVCQQIADLNK